MRIVTVGESMGLVTNDQPGPISSARALSLSFGGAESNVAIALTRLGSHVSWVSLLGADPIGDLIDRELRAEGVDVHARRVQELPTGLMHKHRRTASMSAVSFWRKGSAASFLHPDDVPAGLIESAGILHLTGILPGLSSHALATTRSVVRRAKSAGVRISFDVNHRESIWNKSDARPLYRELASAADLVFAGEDEAAILVGEADPPILARRLLQLGPTEVVIKRGEAGAYGASGAEQVHRNATHVDVVDSVGAGDAFVAGYLSLWNGETSMGERLSRAADVGAFACTCVGDWEGSPTLTDLARMGQREGVTR